jgi:hypothetical protein
MKTSGKSSHSGGGIGSISNAGLATVVGEGCRRVLRMPWRGLFMCPFDVAGLGLRYFNINFSDRFGHPRRKPRRTAFNRVDIFGLQRD